MPDPHYKIEPRKGKLSLLDRINAFLGRKTGKPEELNRVFGKEPFEGTISELELICEIADLSWRVRNPFFREMYGFVNSKGMFLIYTAKVRSRTIPGFSKRLTRYELWSPSEVGGIREARDYIAYIIEEAERLGQKHQRIIPIAYFGDPAYIKGYVV